MDIMLQGSSKILPSALIVEKLFCFPIVRSFAMKGKSQATEKCIWRREKKKEDLKESVIAAKNGPRMMMKVVVTEARIIKIIAKAAFR